MAGALGTHFVNAEYVEWIPAGVLLGRHRRWTLLTKVETPCDRILIAGGANVEAE